MKRKIALALAFVAMLIACYYLMFYVNPILSLMGIGLGIHIIDKIFMKGEE